MFGYIKPLEPQLRVCELDTYKAVYCGVCRGLSKRFGPAARLTLSYDFTFIAMLYVSLGDKEPVFSPQICPVNPFKRRPHLEYCEAVEFSCDMAMLLLREKCVDNIDDSGFIKGLGWRALLPLAQSAAKTAYADRPKAAEIAAEMTRSQREAEAQGESASVDTACNATASALSEIFALITQDETNARILSRLGYMLGRFIYLCDAVDDLDDDIAKENFNPLKHFQDKEKLTEIINMTLGEMGAAYALLEPKYFKEILDNIIYLGLPATAKRLLERRDSTNE